VPPVRHGASPPERRSRPTARSAVAPWWLLQVPAPAAAVPLCACPGRLAGWAILSALDWHPSAGVAAVQLQRFRRDSRLGGQGGDGAAGVVLLALCWMSGCLLLIQQSAAGFFPRLPPKAARIRRGLPNASCRDRLAAALLCGFLFRVDLGCVFRAVSACVSFSDQSLTSDFCERVRTAATGRHLLGESRIVGPKEVRFDNPRRARGPGE
jgi:hypothetical protein